MDNNKEHVASVSFRIATDDIGVLLDEVRSRPKIKQLRVSYLILQEAFSGDKNLFRRMGDHQGGGVSRERSRWFSS
jgi:hypothetical protein